MPSHYKYAVKDCQDRVSVRHRFPNPAKCMAIFKLGMNCIRNKILFEFSELLGLSIHLETLYNYFNVYDHYFVIFSITDRYFFICCYLNYL
nr:unnamed protein product [Callosobruchus chinensis]